MTRCDLSVASSEAFHRARVIEAGFIGVAGPSWACLERISPLRLPIHDAPSPGARAMSASHRAAPTGIIAAMTAAFLAVAGLSAASSAPAQAPDGPPAAWRVECSGDGK